MKMLAAIYARVSSARQKEEKTIVSQTEALRAHAAVAGLDVPPDWVFEDEGYSGATLIRPGLERLRDLAAEIEIPVVLCYAPDRLALAPHWPHRSSSGARDPVASACVQDRPRIRRAGPLRQSRDDRG